jgi:hypothetical protein
MLVVAFRLRGRALGRSICLKLNNNLTRVGKYTIFWKIKERMMGSEFSRDDLTSIFLWAATGFTIGASAMALGFWYEFGPLSEGLVPVDALLGAEGAMIGGLAKLLDLGNAPE